MLSCHEGRDILQGGRSEYVGVAGGGETLAAAPSSRTRRARRCHRRIALRRNGHHPPGSLLRRSPVFSALSSWVKFYEAMANNVSYDDWFDVPGGDSFEDVTSLFIAAGEGMSHEHMRVGEDVQLEFMNRHGTRGGHPHGELHAHGRDECFRGKEQRRDSRVVYNVLLISRGRPQIGEPRLDSGMILEEQRRPPFDPLTPLLPEEVCWLLDRSFACEVNDHGVAALYRIQSFMLFRTITDGMACGEDALAERLHHSLCAPSAGHQP